MFSLSMEKIVSLLDPLGIGNVTIDILAGFLNTIGFAFEPAVFSIKI